MAKLTDIIETLLKEMIDENDGMIEITRGELARRVNCVPSQITYVLSRRFTNSQGYLVESRRGGGGWIRVRRVHTSQPASIYLMHAINSMEDSLSQQEAQIYLRNFVDQGVLCLNTARLIQAAICDQSLVGIPQPDKDRIRLDILHNMLVQLIMNAEREEADPYETL